MIVMIIMIMMIMIMMMVMIDGDHDDYTIGPVVFRAVSLIIRAINCDDNKKLATLPHNTTAQSSTPLHGTLMLAPQYYYVKIHLSMGLF